MLFGGIVKKKNYGIIVPSSKACLLHAWINLSQRVVSGWGAVPRWRVCAKHLKPTRTDVVQSFIQKFNMEQIGKFHSFLTS